MELPPGDRGYGGGKIISADTPKTEEVKAETATV
jgi:hypothetical protein